MRFTISLTFRHQWSITIYAKIWSCQRANPCKIYGFDS